MINIPAQNLEIERIFVQIQASNSRSVAITSANSKEGCTSVALALVERCLLAGNSTLLVDFNLYRPALQSALETTATNAGITQAQLTPPQLVTTDDQQLAITGVVAPDQRALIAQLRKPGGLSACIKQWQQQFQTIVFDTSPVNRANARNIPPEQVAAACDATLLVVLSGHTTAPQVATAVEKLNHNGANLVGTVFNDRDNPPLKQELLRELARLPPRFRSISDHLKRWISGSNLLSVEV